MDGGAGFLVLVIGVPLLVISLLICLCCWCCHCCCCAKNTQQVVVLPPSNPNTTVVNTTMMTPYPQGYAPVPQGYPPPSDPGYVNQLYAAQQRHQLPPAAGQYMQQGPPDDQMLFMDCPPKGRHNETVDPGPRGHHMAPMHGGQSGSETYPEDRATVPLGQANPPPYSALQ